MSTAFQPGAFQSDAFQIAGGLTTTDIDCNISFTLDGCSASLSLNLPASDVTGGWPIYYPRKKKRREEPEPEEVTLPEPEPQPDEATAREILRAQKRADKVMAELKAIYRKMDATEAEIRRKERELEDEEDTLLLLIASM